MVAKWTEITHLNLGIVKASKSGDGLNQRSVVLYAMFVCTGKQGASISSSFHVCVWANRSTNCMWNCIYSMSLHICAGVNRCTVQPVSRRYNTHRKHVKSYIYEPVCVFTHGDTVSWSFYLLHCAHVEMLCACLRLCLHPVYLPAEPVASSSLIAMGQCQALQWQMFQLDGG